MERKKLLQGDLNIRLTASAMQKQVSSCFIFPNGLTGDTRNCFYGVGYYYLKNAGQLWVAWTIESEENYPILRDPRFIQQFDINVTYMNGTPRSGVDQDLATEVTEITESGELVFHPLCALWLNPHLGVPGV